MATASAKTAKKNSPGWVVRLYSDRGINKVEGDVIWRNADNTCLRSRKPGGQSFEERIIPNKVFVGLPPGLQAGDGKTHTFYVQERVLVARFRHATVEPAKEPGFIYVTYTDTRGNVSKILLRSDVVEAKAEKVDAPEGSRKAKKSDKPKKVAAKG